MLKQLLNHWAAAYTGLRPVQGLLQHDCWTAGQWPPAVANYLAVICARSFHDGIVGLLGNIADMAHALASQ